MLPKWAWTAKYWGAQRSRRLTTDLGMHVTQATLRRERPRACSGLVVPGGERAELPFFPWKQTSVNVARSNSLLKYPKMSHAKGAKSSAEILLCDLCGLGVRLFQQPAKEPLNKSTHGKETANLRSFPPISESQSLGKSAQMSADERFKILPGI